MSGKPGALAGGLALGAALVLAACGSAPAASSPAGRVPAAAIAGPALATSVSSSGGASWAIVQMGGSTATHNNFWELFVRPAGTSMWKLATPPGVASNGGIVMAATGATSLIAGFRPSQDLTFSPMAATADTGGQWSQNALLSPGFSDVPYALAGTAAGRLLALTDERSIELGGSLGATWSRLSTQQALASSPAGRACGVAGLTAVAWAPAGDPLIAAACRKPGSAGIFAYSAGAWHAAGPVLPAALRRDEIDVLGLATSGSRTTAILAARSSAGTSLVAAWSADGGTHWNLSAAMSAVPPASRDSGVSVSIWADGSAGIVMPAAHAGGPVGAFIGWQSVWRDLPQLPAGTATLATGADGRLQALEVSQGTLTALEIAPGSGKWTLAQTMQVQIPYGSSG
jgi:hypothetical protein